MERSTQEELLRLSLISATMTTFLTSTHHVYRLGLGVLAPAIIGIALPFVLAQWSRSTKNHVPLAGYVLFNGLVFVWFGFIDGFLDHVLKAAGLQNTTFLPGGQEKVVATVFSLWSPSASNVFYEGTGILTFVASIVMMYYSYRLVRASRFPARRPTTSPVGPGTTISSSM
jgi:hypothetical protein